MGIFLNKLYDLFLLCLSFILAFFCVLFCFPCYLSCCVLNCVPPLNVLPMGFTLELKDTQMYRQTVLGCAMMCGSGPNFQAIVAQKYNGNGIITDIAISDDAIAGLSRGKLYCTYSVGGMTR